MSRVHAARIAGDVVANAYDYTTGALRLEVARLDARRAAPDLHSRALGREASRSRATAPRSTATRDPATGLVEVACDGVLDVTP